MALLSEAGGEKPHPLQTETALCKRKPVLITSSVIPCLTALPECGDQARIYKESSPCSLWAPSLLPPPSISLLSF